MEIGKTVVGWEPTEALFSIEGAVTEWEKNLDGSIIRIRAETVREIRALGRSASITLEFVPQNFEDEEARERVVREIERKLHESVALELMP